MERLTLWAVLAPILLVDVLNPLLQAATVFELGSRRPFLNSTALLLGHTAAYFAVGLLLAVGLEAAAERLANPEPIDFWIELALGVLLLGVGVAMARGKQAESDFSEDGDHGPSACFLMGSIITLIGSPFAVPYFGALSQILKADLSVTGAVFALILYNLLYALPFGLVIAARFVFRERAEEPLRRLSEWMERVSAWLLPLLLLGLAGAFLADAGHFFLRGTPLFDFG